MEIVHTRLSLFDRFCASLDQEYITEFICKNRMMFDNISKSWRHKVYYNSKNITRRNECLDGNIPFLKNSNLNMILAEELNKLFDRAEVKSFFNRFTY